MAAPPREVGSSPPVRRGNIAGMHAVASHGAASAAGLRAPLLAAGNAFHRGIGPSRIDRWGGAIDGGLEHALVASLCFAAILPLLFLARGVDENALTSWRWTFSPSGLVRALAWLGAALVGAIGLSRVSIRGRAAPALLACAAAAAVAPLWREPEVVIDASRYLVQAKFVEEYGAAWFLREWGRAIDAWTDLPLVPFLYGVLFSAAGASRAAAQALDTALFAGTALLTFRIGRALWGEGVGLAAAALLLGSPFLLVQVPLLLVDVPAMFFLALATAALVENAGGRGALRVGGAALAVAAAALTKYSAWPMLAAVGAGCALSVGPDRRRGAARTAAALALAGGLLALAIAARPEVFLAQARVLASFQWSGLGRWREGFPSTFLFQTHPAVTALALAGAARAAAARDRRFALPGLGVLLALAIGSARARYAIPLLPLVAVAAAHGLAAVRDARARRLVALGVVASALVVAYAAYLPFLESTSLANLGRAGAYLDALEGDVVEVRGEPQRRSTGSTSAAVPLLAYATRKRIASAEWPAAPDGEALRSSLRFSWELRRPSFWAGPARAGAPLAVISDEPPAATPSGLRERARFAATSGVFLYRTLVTVYDREPRTEP